MCSLPVCPPLLCQLGTVPPSCSTRHYPLAIGCKCPHRKQSCSLSRRLPPSCLAGSHAGCQRSPQSPPLPASVTEGEKMQSQQTCHAACSKRATVRHPIRQQDRPQPTANPPAPAVNTRAQNPCCICTFSTNGVTFVTAPATTCSG